MYKVTLQQLSMKIFSAFDYQRRVVIRIIKGGVSEEKKIKKIMISYLYGNGIVTSLPPNLPSQSTWMCKSLHSLCNIYSYDSLFTYVYDKRRFHVDLPFTFISSPTP